MITDISYIEPSEVFQGDSINFDINLQSIGIKASDGWSLVYSFMDSLGQQDPVTATANGDNFSIAISAATTANYRVGLLSFVSKVSKDAVVKTIKSGTINIKSSFVDLTSFDGRTHAQKVLENIEAVLEKTATKDQESYSIKGRSLSRRSLEELTTLRDKYKREVQQEKNEVDRKNGKASQSIVYARFS
jgi:hypothetical protein